MKSVKQKLADELSEAIDAEVSWKDIEVPDREQADFAYPAMKAASELGRAPREVAREAADAVELNIVDEIEVAGPGYVNFHLDPELYGKTIVENLSRESMGVEQRDGNVLVEFSSPNLAKPMHVGHLRNNCIGDSLQRILRFVGYNVTSENYIGDWGTKHGQVIYAYRKWGDREEFRENPMEHMYELYVRLHDEADEEDRERAREWSRKIEEGDEEAVELWKMFRDATIKHNEKEYERMGIEFDRVTGESVVADEAREIIEEGLERGIFERDEDGSVYVDFEEEEYPSTVVKRGDGSTLYLSRDVANIRKREKEGFDTNMYVVASEQDLHFKQLFRVAEEFGYTSMENEHISYGMLHLQEGSMSSSEGNIIRLSEIMDRAKERAAEAESREISNSEEVGLGAIKYANLRISRDKDIEFSWERALSFEGDSGPYLQYSNTRAKSILEKTDCSSEFSGEPGEEEYRLLKLMAIFPEKVERAADQREPAKIANYLSELCEQFNSFYHSTPVLDAGPGERQRLVATLESFVRVTDTGLELLGIEPLDEM